MENEIWKDIEGYEGKYQVSNLGRVKSLNYRHTGKEKIMEPYDNGKGYLRVRLYKEGSRKKYLVHQLVGNAFLPNPQGYKEINHISEDKTDNRAENLEWCSSKYNCNYGTRNKRMAEKLGKPIYGINKVSGLIVEFPSAREAERTLGINKASICLCCQGKQKSSGGFYWFYAESEEVCNEQE